MTDRLPIVFLMGPTASGKTALALDLAASGRFGLISVDSALVYRGLNIGSAKPDPATLSKFPHHLIDIRDPNETYSAAAFRADALRAIETIHREGRTPLLVGGTGLYFRALQYGLSDLPGADSELRAQLQAELEQLGALAMHARLNARDPVAAARIHANDPQRVLRALEVIELTGLPLSVQQLGKQLRLPFRILKLVAMPEDRDVLHQRIAARLDEMWQLGLVDEVRELRQKCGLSADLPSMRAVGYRQVWQHMEGEFDAVEMRERALFATRQLAKRQITWLRAERDSIWFDPIQTAPLNRITRLITQFV